MTRPRPDTTARAGRRVATSELRQQLMQLRDERLIIQRATMMHRPKLTQLSDQSLAVNIDHRRSSD